MNTLEKSSKKILLFSTSFNEYVISLGKGLKAHGATVTILLPRQRLDQVHNALLKEFDHEAYDLIDYQSVRKNLQMILHLVRLIRKRQPDIVHLQSNGHRWFWLAYILLPGIKFVSTIHDPVLHMGDKASNRNVLTDFFSKFYVSQFIVHGEFLKKQLHAAQGISLDKISVIPHGHLGIFKKWNRIPDKWQGRPDVVLFFGRIWPYKGLEYFIEMGHELIKIQPDIRLIIAGYGEDFAKYEALINGSENFDVRNKRISNSEVVEILTNTDVIVLPYLEATQSGVVALGYSFGIPTIVTDVGSLSEVVDNGETGFVVPSKDVQALVDRTMEILNNDLLREIMYKNTVQKTNTHLDWNQIANRTLNVYNRL